VTGTAAGLAREIGIDPAWVRVSLIVLFAAGGWGLAIYLGAWALLAYEPGSTKPYVPRAKGVTPKVRLIAFQMVVVGLLILSGTLGLSFLGSLIWPIVFLGAAVAVAADKSNVDRIRNLGDFSDRTVASRLAVGLGLLFAGIISASFISLDFWDAVGGVAVSGLVLVGAGIVFAPILRNMGADLLTERRMRIRSEERAEMAAHLHDSVLQTLTLIQKRSHDASVVSLARRQERELRSWLFDDKAMNPNLGFRAGIEAAVAAVEEVYEVPIELVVVGDCPTDPDVVALLKATREAAANAARHSGAKRVDVFAEVGNESIEVFVRDTGVGFNFETIEEDRAGVRDSIIARIERHGGSVAIHSTVSAGTEIELVLPRRDAIDPEMVETF